MATGPDPWRAIGQDARGRPVFYLRLAALDGATYTEGDLAARAASLASQSGCAAKSGVWIVNAKGARDQRGANPAYVVLFFPEAHLAEGVCVLPNASFQAALLKTQKQRQHVKDKVQLVHLPQMRTKFPDLWALIEASGGP